MTTPLLNELLTEAVERCDTLAAEARTAASTASDVTEDALALAEAVEHEAEQLHAQVQHAIAALHETADRTVAAVDHAIAALDGLPARTAESEAHVRGVFDALREEVLRLDDARVHLLEGIQTAAGELDHGVETVAEHVRSFSSQVGETWPQSMLGLKTLAHDGTEMRMHLEERFQLVTHDVQVLGVTALEQTQKFAAGLDHGVQTLADHLTAALDAAIHGHNTAVQDLRAGTLDETAAGVPDPSWVDEAFTPLQTEMGYLEPLPDNLEQATAAPANTVVDAASRATDQLEQVSRSVAKAHPG